MHKQALYAQIEAILRERIASGAYPAGSRFPTDESLGDEFRVSRNTVREALHVLHREGAIVRFPGRGSFVTAKAARPQSLRFSGSIEEMITRGDGAGTEHFIVRRELSEPTTLETEELQLAESRVVRLTGFRMRDGVRMGHVRISLPESTGRRLDLRAGRTYASVYRALESKLGLKVMSVRQVISAAMPDPEVATDLGIRPDVPVLVRRRTFYGAGGTPMELAVTCYPGDRYQYEIDIT